MTHSRHTYDLSIISANYNNGRYLTDFINSILTSSAWPRELILVDDGSVDDSLDILENLQDIPFLKIISLGHNMGLSVALNTALEAAQGQFIMRADPDDLFLPQRIATQVSYLEEHPEIDILGSNVIYFNDITGKPINKSNFPLKHQAIVRMFRRGELGLQHPTACMKASAFKKFRYTPGLSPSEDYDIFSRMALDGFRFKNLRKPLYMMRVHPASSTSNTSLRAVTQTYAYRDMLWGTRTSKRRIWCYYQHIMHYRKFQLSANPLRKYLNLAIAALFSPGKIFNRMQIFHIDKTN